jgi:hypothetical protein
MLCDLKIKANLGEKKTPNVQRSTSNVQLISEALRAAFFLIGRWTLDVERWTFS